MPGSFLPVRAIPTTRMTARSIYAIIVFLMFAGTMFPGHAYAEPEIPQLWLPTPRGESWRILQGYACGSHNGWDRYSLDLVNAKGRTFGAPVYAVADGVVFVWSRRTGTLILSHGNNFYTMYTHMDNAVSTQGGTFFARGAQIGVVGERATRGLPHLHFTAFIAQGASAYKRQSVPLSFGEGYNLPEIGGCSQHDGEVLVAGTPAISLSPGMNFNTSVEQGRWYNSNIRIEFGGTGAAGGFSQAWNQAPGGDEPMFVQERSGLAEIASIGEGLHTLYIRSWDAEGHQTVASYGPVGYDITPPAPVQPLELVIAKGTPVLSWQPAVDAGSGVAGYRIYIGDDPGGTSEWFVNEPQVIPPSIISRAWLRVQPIDYAGNAGQWSTLGQIQVEP